MKKSLWISLVMAVILLPGIAPAKQVTLKLASWGPTQHFVAQAREVWIDEVNKALAGRYEIVDYPGGQLYGPSDIHKGRCQGPCRYRCHPPAGHVGHGAHGPGGLSALCL